MNVRLVQLYGPRHGAFRFRAELAQNPAVWEAGSDEQDAMARLYDRLKVASFCELRPLPTCLGDAAPATRVFVVDVPSLDSQFSTLQ